MVLPVSRILSWFQGLNSFIILLIWLVWSWKFCGEVVDGWMVERILCPSLHASLVYNGCELSSQWSAVISRSLHYSMILTLCPSLSMLVVQETPLKSDGWDGKSVPNGLSVICRFTGLTFGFHVNELSFFFGSWILLWSSIPLSKKVSRLRILGLSIILWNSSSHSLGSLSLFLFYY